MDPTNPVDSIEIGFCAKGGQKSGFFCGHYTPPCESFQRRTYVLYIIVEESVGFVKWLVIKRQIYATIIAIYAKMQKRMSLILTQAEGVVLGVGAKMFIIAGPVIVYGTVASVVYGVVYWVTTVF